MTDSRDRLRTCVPLVIPGLVEAAAWRDSDERWLAAVLEELEREVVTVGGRSTGPDTRDLGDGRVETTIELLRAGNFVHRSQGKFSVDGRVLDEIVANFAADSHMGGHPHAVFITIGHPAGELDGKPAAGWITDVWRLGDSVFGRITLNAKTVEMIRAGEFKYFSPDFHVRNWTDETGRIVGAKLHSGAITNFPFIRGMAPFQLSALLGDAGDDEMSLTPDQVKTMVTEQVTALGTQLRQDLAKDVGSAIKAQLADATKDLSRQVAENLKASADAASSSGGPDLKTLSDTVRGLEGNLQKALADNKRLSDALGSTNEVLEARDVTDLVERGLRAGKLTAGEAPGFGTDSWDALKWLKDDGRFATVSHLRTHIAKAPVVVKLSDAGNPGSGAANAGGTQGGGSKEPAHLRLSDDEAKRLGFKDSADFDRLAAAHDAPAA